MKLFKAAFFSYSISVMLQIILALVWQQGAGGGLYDGGIKGFVFILISNLIQASFVQLLISLANLIQAAYFRSRNMIVYGNAALFKFYMAYIIIWLIPFMIILFSDPFDLKDSYYILVLWVMRFAPYMIGSAVAVIFFRYFLRKLYQAESFHHQNVQHNETI